LLHVAVWSGIYAFWLFATRNHHPTWTIALLATLVLVAAFALAVYLNGLFLQPEFARRRLWLQYAAALLATIIVLNLAAVFLIQFIYDRLWGPDPLRYGFWFNVMSDGALIIIHLAAAMGVMWLVKRLRRKGEAA
jgi:hypothetical protein